MIVSSVEFREVQRVDAEIFARQAMCCMYEIYRVSLGRQAKLACKEKNTQEPRICLYVSGYFVRHPRDVVTLSPAHTEAGENKMFLPKGPT
jgi:hypothetical protein